MGQPRVGTRARRALLLGPREQRRAGGWITGAVGAAALVWAAASEAALGLPPGLDAAVLADELDELDGGLAARVVEPAAAVDHVVLLRRHA